MLRLMITMILLSIPVTDLLTPGVCPEELQGWPPFVTEIDHAQPDQGVVPPPRDGEDEHSKLPCSPLDDECFCCCRHLVPQLAFLIPACALSVTAPSAPITSLAASPEDPPYHPPRNA
ncbi:MAG: hypothetical protein HY650_09805 [Acidobacteria bacterium]|nr:hypothetical protein [Acidobacteriota bacterium]